jgi:phospholipase/carboxylesterase
MSPYSYQVIDGAGQDHTPLLLLHGSGGSEQDMVPLASQLAPASFTVAIRGAVPWEHGFAFFRRFEDRTIDEDDLVARAAELADAMVRIGTDHHFPRRPIAVGFSNGAIMAATLLMLYPDRLSGLVLFRPLSPFADDPDVRVPEIPTLIIDGQHDERRSPGDGARLAQRLLQMGARVTHHVLPTGHPITDDDIRLAREWLRPLL